MTAPMHDEAPEGPPPRDRRGRILTGFTIAALVTAGGLVVAAARADDDDATVVLDVESASAPVPPTVAPIVTSPPPTPSSTVAALTADDPESPPTSTEEQLSPLADLLGEQYSAVPDEAAPRPRPVAMEIDAFDVTDVPIRAVGLEPDGQLEIPDETEIGWYQYGATAGRPGATVLAAHVSWNGSVGPFGSLGILEPGNQISVTLDDGTTRRYEVFERAIYGKLELPRDRIWRNTGPETLVLITCGGDFNPEVRRYRENIVVYAAPIA